MSEIAQFFGVMMTLLITGLTGYAGVTFIHRMQGRSKASGAELDPAELDDFRAQLAEIDHLRERVSELEGRLDFTERLLAQREDVHRIEGSA